jgi:hypothetical protein
MKKLNVTLTFTGATTDTKTLTGISKRELNDVWRACYAALGFMSNLSDVYTVVETDGEVEPDPDGRQSLTLSYEVKTDKKGEAFASGLLTWENLDRNQMAFLIAAFENEFLKAGINWH